jgi:hypothetical protein
VYSRLAALSSTVEGKKGSIGLRCKQYRAV